MNDAVSRRATDAYRDASVGRQRSILRDVSRTELAIVRESDLCYGLILSDYREGTLSSSSILRRLEAFSMSVRDVLDDSLRLGSVDWWRSAVELWGVAAEKDPRILASIALAPERPLIESKTRTVLGALFEILKAPETLEVLSIINAPVNGKTWRERLSTMTSQRISSARVAKAVAVAYSAGGNIEDVRRAIRPLVQSSAAAARTIARTESVRVANAMAERSMSQAGSALLGYTYNATLDDVVRPEHAARNGRVYKVGEKRIELPDGPNCRCWYTPILSSDVKVFGRPGSLPPEASKVVAFASWFDQQTPGRRIAIVGEKVYRAAALKAGVAVPSWEDVGAVSPNIESERIRGELETKQAAARAARKGAA